MKQSNRNEKVNSKEIIIGTHSIFEALKSEKRTDHILFGTKKGFSDFQKYLSELKDITFQKEILLQHDLNTLYSKLAKSEKTKSRLPGQLFLEVSPYQWMNAHELNLALDKGREVVLCLDSISDINNIAAIIRSCAFFGLKYILINRKEPFRLSSSFCRVASGGLEYVNLVYTPSLSRFFSKKSLESDIIVGMDEGSSNDIDSMIKSSYAGGKNIYLVVGAEDKGISNAVKRNLNYSFNLVSAHTFSTLNASVAAALGISKVLKNFQ